MATQKKYSQEFKNDAVEYRKSHAELSLKTCAANNRMQSCRLKHARQISVCHRYH